MNQSNPSQSNPTRNDLLPQSRCHQSSRAWAAGLALFGLGLFGVVTLSGCGGGSANQPGPIALLEAPAFTRQWATNLKLASGDSVATVYARDEWIFAYTKKGWVYAIRRATGEQIFALQVPGGDYQLHPPILLKEHIVFPTLNTLEVYSLIGSPERTIQVGAAIRADCVGERTNIFVPVDSPEGGGRIKRIDLLIPSGGLAWELQAQKGGIVSAPALQGDAVYMASEVGTVYAVNTKREPIWQLEGYTFDARSPIYAPLKADEAGVYIGTASGKFYCVNRTSGVVKWQYFASAPIEVAPVLTTDTIYIYDANRGWAAVDKVDSADIKGPQYNRKDRWVRKDIKQVVSQDEKFTYVMDKSSALLALDKKTGETRFKSKRSDFHTFATNSKDGVAYAASAGGRIAAIKAVLTPGTTGEVVLLDDDKTPEGVVVDAAK